MVQILLGISLKWIRRKATNDSIAQCSCGVQEADLGHSRLCAKVAYKVLRT